MKKELIAALSLLLAGTAFASSFSRDYYSVDKVNAVKAELKYEDIVIGVSENDEIKLEISCNNYHKMPQVSVEDGVLLIKNVKKGTYAENCTVYVYLPENLDTEFVEIANLSGDITVEDIFAQEIILTASSGDIDCINVEASGDIKATAASGDITMKVVSADEISVTVASGDIDLKTVDCNELNIKAASGDVEAENIEAGNIECDTASGSQEFGKVDCNSFELHAISGSVYIKLNEVPSEESSIETVSGSVDLRIPRTSKFQLKVSSISGSFDDDFDGNEFKPRGGVLSKYNGGGTLITVETKSGSISLDD